MATKPKQDDGDGNDVRDSQDNVIEGNAPLIVKPKQGASGNPNGLAAFQKKEDRTKAERDADLEDTKARTAATKQATAAKATEMASTYRPMGSSYRRNGDGTYTQNAPLSPDAQSDSPAPQGATQAPSGSNPSPQGAPSVATSVTPSRIDAFKASQGTQTANEKLNGIAAGTGGHSWDANDPQNNPTLQAKMKDAVSGVIAGKLAAGVDPSTNILTGGPSRDITGSASASLAATSDNAGAREREINNSISSMAKDGNMTGAIKLQPAAQAASKTAFQYGDTANKVADGNVQMTPYGVVSGSKGLGSGGLERLMASPAVQNAAKATNSPAAMAAVTPSPAGSAATATASATPPRQVKQAAYTPPASPLMGGVTPKVKRPTNSPKDPSIIA